MHFRPSNNNTTKHKMTDEIDVPTSETEMKPKPNDLTDKVNKETHN